MQSKAFAKAKNYRVKSFTRHGGAKKIKRRRNKKARAFDRYIAKKALVIEDFDIFNPVWKQTGERKVI